MSRLRDDASRLEEHVLGCAPTGVGSGTRGIIQIHLGTMPGCGVHSLFGTSKGWVKDKNNTILWRAGMSKDQYGSCNNLILKLVP